MLINREIIDINVICHDHKLTSLLLFFLYPSLRLLSTKLMLLVQIKDHYDSNCY